MRVLVVEDEPRVGSLMADVLETLGHQAQLVPTAEAALERIRRERPDAVLLDIVLPGMSGLDFLRHPVVREYEVPVVAVSGVMTESQAQDCLRLGALEVLAKPVPIERLSALLTALELQTLQTPPERRRLPRLAIDVPVTVGFERRWVSVDLSPLGVKVPSQSWLGLGARVALALSLPDGGPALEVEAVLMRTGADGDFFAFVRLEPAAFNRLVRFLGAGGRPPDPAPGAGPA